MSATEPLSSLQRCIQAALDECRLQRAFDDGGDVASVSTSLEWPAAAVKAANTPAAAAAQASCHVIVQLANAFKAKLRARNKEAAAISAAAAAPSSIAASSSSCADTFDVPTALARWGTILRERLMRDPAMTEWSCEVVKGYLNFSRRSDLPSATSASSSTDAAAVTGLSALLPFAPSAAASAASASLPPAPLSQASSFTFSSLGTWRSIFKEKHGTPRQGAVVPSARGSLTLHASISPASLEGLSEYSHAWIVFVFHSNNSNSGSSGSGGQGASAGSQPFASGKIKPPRLGGKRVGLFATRSPHRPNPIGLSLARIDRIDTGGAVVHFSGIDLIDGTPVIDIKPYHPADCVQQYSVPQWMDAAPERSLDVAWGAGTLAQLQRFVSSADHGLEFYSRSETETVRRLIESILEQDPRTLHSKEKHAAGGVYGICVDRIDVAFKIVQLNGSGAAVETAPMDLAAAEPAAAASSFSLSSSAAAGASASAWAPAPAPVSRLTALIFDLEYFAPHADRPRQRTKEWLGRITAKSNAAATADASAQASTAAGAAVAAASAVSPPAARLVGIELNPGPPKKRSAAVAASSSAAAASSSSASDAVSSLCAHAHLLTEPSAHAAEAGYVRPPLEERRAAALLAEPTAVGKSKAKGKRSRADVEAAASSSSSSAAAAAASSIAPPSVAIDPLRYPAPLCLPGDDLSLDPECPLQSLSEWVGDADRNEVTATRRTIYVVAPPKLERRYLKEWTQPHVAVSVSASAAVSTSAAAAAHQSNLITPPRMSDVVAYLSAFYAGMSIRQLPALTLTAWDADDGEEEDAPSAAASSSSSAAAAPSSRSSVKSASASTKAGPRYVALNTATEGVRIRTRASLDGTYARQLNLNDLLDAAIGMLPRDAYALLLLVDHDLYESKDDLFCCGRAYGGSRVAVISAARYHPSLDAMQNVEREHAWPAAHCAEYVRAIVEEQGQETKKKNKKAKVKHGADAATAAPSADSVAAASSCTGVSAVSPSPLSAAIAAHAALSPSAASSSSSSAASSSASFLSGLWLGRVCRTSAHELGHCFGLEHCTAYACAMQGSANLIEDARQPPYLCPIDEAKLTMATGADASTRNRALLRFCEQHPHVQLFAAFAAWIRGASGAPVAAASS